jgi:hypothetical protein
MTFLPALGNYSRKVFDVFCLGDWQEATAAGQSGQDRLFEFLWMDIGCVV